MWGGAAAIGQRRGGSRERTFVPYAGSRERLVAARGGRASSSTHLRGRGTFRHGRTCAFATRLCGQTPLRGARMSKCFLQNPQIRVPIASRIRAELPSGLRWSCLSLQSYSESRPRDTSLSFPLCRVRPLCHGCSCLRPSASGLLFRGR